ncbi:MAG: hypothetical protein ACRECH_08725 [Nitrososphaerales archaeon]
MIEELSLYALTSAVSFLAWPFIWREGKLTTLRMVILLFFWDIALTIEAAFYANIVFIGVLHVVTIPALLGLLYFDLLKQNKTVFTCFICSRQIRPEEEMESVTRVVRALETKVSVHVSCVEVGRRERKALSGRIFKRGIPK